MASVYAKKFNWLPQLSAWEQAQAWRARRRAMVDDFRGNADALASGFGGALANQISGQGTIAVQIATSRLQAEAKAKVARATSLSSSVNQLA